MMQSRTIPYALLTRLDHARIVWTTMHRVSVQQALPPLPSKRTPSASVLARAASEPSTSEPKDQQLTAGIVRRQVELASSRAREVSSVVDPRALRLRVAGLENEASGGGLWETDPQKAKAITQQVGFGERKYYWSDRTADRGGAVVVITRRRFSSHLCDSLSSFLLQTPHMNPAPAGVRPAF